MFENITSVLQDGAQNVGILLKSKMDERISNPTGYKVGKWVGDEDLANTITNLKSIANTLSNSCIKLALLVRAKPSDNALNSLLTELSSEIQSLLGIYL